MRILERREKYWHHTHTHTIVIVIIIIIIIVSNNK